MENEFSTGKRAYDATNGQLESLSNKRRAISPLDSNIDCLKVDECSDLLGTDLDQGENEESITVTQAERRKLLNRRNKVTIGVLVVIIGSS